MDSRRTNRRSLIMAVEAISGYPAGNAIVIDYSPLGIKIETNFPMQPNEMVRISLRSQPGEDLLILPAQVAWINQLSTEPQKYHVGLRFTNPLYCRY